MKGKKIKDKNGLPKKKKLYQKPEVISEKTFETAALSCNKCEIIGPEGYCWGMQGAS